MESLHNRDHPQTMALCSSGSKEKVLDETGTEPGSKHSSDPKNKVLDEKFTEPGNKHSSGSKEEALLATTRILCFRIIKWNPFITVIILRQWRYVLGFHFRTRKMFATW
jgi:hypothetical protein